MVWSHNPPLIMAKLRTPVGPSTTTLRKTVAITPLTETTTPFAGTTTPLTGTTTPFTATTAPLTVAIASHPKTTSSSLGAPSPVPLILFSKPFALSAKDKKAKMLAGMRNNA